MILHVALLLMPLNLTPVADTDPVANPVYTCKFNAGLIVIGQAEENGQLTVEINGQARPYVMEKLRLVPRERGLPTFLFQPDVRRWQWLDTMAEPIESIACSEKPSLNAG